jgi:hypothetical protein
MIASLERTINMWTSRGMALMLVLFVCASSPLFAQGAPPLLTNDPDTPGNGNWEINLGFLPVLRESPNVYHTPQIDINFGLGDRIQLTYEIPYVFQTESGQPTRTGWSNAFPGLKFRFLNDEHGWNASLFPQLEPGGLSVSVRSRIAERGARLLLTAEITKSAGPVNFRFEAGYYVPWHSHEERIVEFTLGHDLTPKLNILGEIYNDRAMGTLPQDTTFDAGGQYRFHKGLVVLFAAGRSFSGNATGQPEFTGYLGMQILLQKFGEELQSAP